MANDILRRLSVLRELTWGNLLNVIDILLVAYLIFRLLQLVRGTRNWRIVGGIGTFVVALFLSDLLRLHTLHWVLDKATLLAPVALVILLLPELRQTLEGFARLGLWPERLRGADHQTAARTIEEIIAGVAEMSASRLGAIIVIERSGHLDEVISSGVQVSAQVSAPLLGSIFYHGSPLHDGAVVIRGDTIAAAACRLPLSESAKLDTSVHMRHRAGLGITEQADSIAIIVSEERGSVSVAIEGTLKKLASHLELRDILNRELRALEGVSEDRGSKPRRKRDKEKVLG